MNKHIRSWEVCSAAVIIMLGFLFHFAFAWTGEWRPAAFLFAVNESVWEHCKMGFWPALWFALVEYFFIRRAANNFLAAKAALTLFITAAIITLFYTYTGIIGRHYLPIDIGIFLAAVLGGQLISYKLLVHRPLPAYLQVVAIAVIILLTISFSTFTFFPGSIPLFVDPSTGRAGIP